MSLNTERMEKQLFMSSVQALSTVKNMNNILPKNFSVLIYPFVNGASYSRPPCIPGYPEDTFLFIAQGLHDHGSGLTYLLDDGYYGRSRRYQASNLLEMIYRMESSVVVGGIYSYELVDLIGQNFKFNPSLTKKTLEHMSRLGMLSMRDKISGQVITGTYENNTFLGLDQSRKEYFELPIKKVRKDDVSLSKGESFDSDWVGESLSHNTRLVLMQPSSTRRQILESPMQPTIKLPPVNLEFSADTAMTWAYSPLFARFWALGPESFKSKIRESIIQTSTRFAEQADNQYVGVYDLHDADCYVPEFCKDKKDIIRIIAGTLEENFKSVKTGCYGEENFPFVVFSNKELETDNFPSLDL